MKTVIVMWVCYVALALAALIGEIKCIIKMINCNWEPIGKAETIYTIGTFTGLGCVIGYVNIEDK
jgi:hypothetical protein